MTSGAGGRRIFPWPPTSSTGSPWAYCVTEEEKAAGSWRAVRSRPLRRLQEYAVVQSFKEYEELRLKVSAMGEEAIRWIRPFVGRTDFAIPMTYGIALI